jgi:Uma2 family endonuclease
LRRHFGMIPAERILLHPLPGTASEKDLLRVNDEGRTLVELVDGVLVEKAMGAKEAMLAGILLQWLWNFLDQHDLGIALGADATLRLMPGLVRSPDVSFVSWDRLPAGELTDEPIPDLSPNLAVEVISKSNTKKEMERKLGEYFSQRVELVWLIYPRKRTVEVYTSPEAKQELGNGDTLDGGSVLPGFEVPLAAFFAPRRRKA